MLENEAAARPEFPGEDAMDAARYGISVRDCRGDELASLLAPIRAQSTIIAHGGFRGEWGFSCAGGRPHLLHYAVMGPPAILEMAGRPPCMLNSGDVVILTRSVEHRIRHARATNCVPIAWPAIDHREHCYHQEVYSLGIDGALSEAVVDLSPDLEMPPDNQTHLCATVCTFEPVGSRAVFAILPDVIHIRGTNGRLPEWLSALTQIATTRFGQGLGGAVVCSRINEIFLMYAVLGHFNQLQDQALDMGSLIQAPNIVTTIAALHIDPHEHRTTESMARAAGMSRSSFAAAFKKAVGMGPVGYLRHFRLEQSIELLSTTLPIGEIAHRIGYESPLAFQRAFRREYGVSPAVFRSRLAAVGARSASC